MAATPTYTKLFVYVLISLNSFNQNSNWKKLVLKRERKKIHITFQQGTTKEVRMNA